MCAGGLALGAGSGTSANCSPTVLGRVEEEAGPGTGQYSGL